MNLPSEGTRISLAGDLGTIKFVGPVDNTSGIWLGVEWDDPRRGRHDGIKDGKCYFACRIRNAGSFIRPSSNILYGKTFLEALASKYIETLHGSQSQEKVLLGSSQGAIVVEAVRLDKIRGKLASLERLREVSLDNEHPARSNPLGAIRRTCPNIQGLDLSSSLLPSWEEVALIAIELPALQRLALNRNRLLPPTNHSLMMDAFRNLTELQLNGTLMPWSEMQTVLTSMPKLRLVELGYNQLTFLSTTDDCSHDHRALQVINLDSNTCSDWVHVCKSLHQYASLERVVLTSNYISTIPMPEPLQQRLYSLKHVSLSFNLLNVWSDVDALSLWCPGLETLTLSGNPLFDRKVARYTRPFTIAKIPSLLALDGALISPKERADSEMFYLSHVMQHFASEDERVQAHPQWLNLCAKHGRPNEDSISLALGQDKLSNHLIVLNLYQNPHPNHVNAEVHTLLKSTKPILLRALPTMSLRTLRMKICKLMKQRNANVLLWLVMAGDAVRQLDEGDDNRELDRLGLDDGSHIVFNISPF